MGINVMPQPTPNPNSVKFTLDRPVIDDGPKSYFSAAETDTPLSKDLFAVEGVANLFFLNNFITVSKEDSADWNQLVPEIEQRIQKHFSS